MREASRVRKHLRGGAGGLARMAIEHANEGRSRPSKEMLQLATYEFEQGSGSKATGREREEVIKYCYDLVAQAIR